MYDIKVYKDENEEETIRNLSITQTSAIQSVFDRYGVTYKIKRRLTPEKVDISKAEKLMKDAIKDFLDKPRS